MLEMLKMDSALLGDPTVWFRLTVSILCGVIIGVEREMHNKPAGLRTTMLICIGAAIYAMIGVEITERSGGQADPTRVAAQIVTGVGFLGAGVIMHIGATVKGLTTAAAIWVTAAVGTMAGLGYPITALVATAGIIVCLVILNTVEIRLLRAGKD